MQAAVLGGGSGWNGGLYAPSGRPTAVGGGGFGSPGTSASTPPSVPSSGIIEARNNRGSNVRLPYARLVPMHARANGNLQNNDKDPRDERLVRVNGKDQLEYDGLRNGELAWILGRRFRAPGSGAIPASSELGLDDQSLSASVRFAHQAYGGTGHGVDRMQRLASTAWVEAMFEQKLASLVVDLAKVRLDSGFARVADSGLDMYREILAGSSALYTIDVARALKFVEKGTGQASLVDMQSPEPTNPPPAPKRSIDQAINYDHAAGIFVMDSGPFLRGMNVLCDRVELGRISGLAAGSIAAHDVSRNLGDSLAFAALESELRRLNVMDWTPDGIILSKLDSPTDEPLKSAEMDARSAQLFNVAIQGPAISTSWTSDVGDFKLECQPLDKVFVCMVATVTWMTVGDTANDNISVDQPTKELANSNISQAMLAKQMRRVHLARNNNNATPAARDDEVKALGRASERAKGAATALQNRSPAWGIAPYEILKDEYTKARKDHERDTKNAAFKTKFEDAERAFVQTVSKRAEQSDEIVIDDNKFGLNGKSVAERTFKGMGVLEKVQQLVRTHGTTVVSAKLSNFRLIRSTSSHMANYSYYRPGAAGSRLDLPLGSVSYDDGAEVFDGWGDYIVGAWCVGSVLDSAASRSTMGSLVRTKPTSMALNVNVGIEWWSGDRLHRHFMDGGTPGGGVTMRGLDKADPTTMMVSRSVREVLDAEKPQRKVQRFVDEAEEISQGDVPANSADAIIPKAVDNTMHYASAAGGGIDLFDRVVSRPDPQTRAPAAASSTSIGERQPQSSRAPLRRA